jgi:hypothetical protein
VGSLEKAVQGWGNSDSERLNFYRQMMDNVQNISHDYERNSWSLKLLVRERNPSLFLYEYYPKYIRTRNDYETITQT